MRSVEIRNGRLFYYGSAVGYLEGDGITADPMFRREDLERWLERKNLPVRWVDGVYDRLARGAHSKRPAPQVPADLATQARYPHRNALHWAGANGQRIRWPQPKPISHCL